MKHCIGKEMAGFGLDIKINYSLEKNYVPITRIKAEIAKFLKLMSLG